MSYRPTEKDRQGNNGGGTEYSSRDATIAVLNYNGREMLADCFDSIARLDSAPAEIIMIDDGSSDGSVELVREKFRHVRILEMGENTRRLNRVRNTALRESATDLVMLVDNDVTLKPDCLDKLLASLNTLEDAAVCMPRALYHHDSSKIYQDGQVLHYVATSYALNRNIPVEGVDESPRISIGWGVQLIDRVKAASVGLFNENYVMGWGDDGEFNHRMNLAGYLCYHVPSAIVYHMRVNPAHRYYGSVRNRWRFMLETYQLRTLVLCLPAFLVYEVALLGFLLVKHAAGDYLRAMGDTLRQLPDILASRRRIQKYRRVKDVELMTSGQIFIAPEYVNVRLLSWGFGALNGFLNGYWRLVRVLL